MESLIPIKVPFLNPNEPDALLAQILVSEGSTLQEGQAVAVIETTKSTGEVVAEAAGFLVGLRFKEGDLVAAGDVLAYIGTSPDARDNSLPPWAPKSKPAAPESTSGELRITEPARQLAAEKGLDLDDLPKGTLVTRQTIASLYQNQVPWKSSLPPTDADDKRLIIYGAGGHGRSLAALIQESRTFKVVGFVDDGISSEETVLGLKVFGGHEILNDLYRDGIRYAVNGVGGISDLETRLKVFKWLGEAGFRFPVVIHPSAFLEENATLAPGTQVFPLAYVGIEVKAGFGSIVNTGAIISHDCTLGEYVNLSPGATLAGGVQVGEETLIGMRATVNLYVKIGRRARIGNGATVKADVPDGGIVPAGTIWPPRR